MLKDNGGRGKEGRNQPTREGEDEESRATREKGITSANTAYQTFLYSFYHHAHFHTHLIRSIPGTLERALEK